MTTLGRTDEHTALIATLTVEQGRDDRLNRDWASKDAPLRLRYIPGAVGLAPAATADVSFTPSGRDFTVAAIFGMRHRADYRTAKEMGRSRLTPTARSDNFEPKERLRPLPRLDHRRRHRRSALRHGAAGLAPRRGRGALELAAELPRPAPAPGSIVTRTQPPAAGCGLASPPRASHSAEQVEGRRGAAEAAHADGGRVAAQPRTRVVHRSLDNK